MSKGPKKTLVRLSSEKVPVYGGDRFARALDEVAKGMDLYKLAKLTVVLETMYVQGRKNGARQVVESFEKATKTIPYKNPGQPRKKHK
jgi:hypothetical protein